MSGFGTVFAGLILSWSGFPEKATLDNVTDGIRISLIFHFVPFYVSAQLLSIYFLRQYKIDRAQHLRNLEQLGGGQEMVVLRSGS